MSQIREQLEAQLPTPITRQKEKGDRSHLQKLYEIAGRSDCRAGALVGMSPSGFGNIRRGQKPCTKTVEIAVRGVLAQLGQSEEPKEVVMLARIPSEHETTVKTLFDALGIKWGSV